MDTREAAERHRRLQELFLQATQTIEAERCAFLDKACAGDPVMRREIERLLAADRETGGLLDGPAFGYRGQWAQECPQCLTCFDAGPQQCSLDGTTLQPAFEGPLLIDGRYRIEKRLGSGGMGAVYRALHIGLDKRFAVKMIRAGPMLSEAMRERFRHEGKALGRLKHPHIVDVTDAGVDCSIGPGGRPYLVMELLEGSTLQAALKSEGTLPVPRALPILRAVADAMDFAHRHQVIHGDIKPANVLLTADGGVKILDFGVAELLDSGSGPRPVMGTPAYMTAAVLGGAAIARSADHHALAVLTYELLTGEVPFGSKSADVVARQKLPVRLLSAMHPALPLELDAPAAAGFQRTFDSALDFIAPLEAAWHRVCVRQWLRREIPARSALAAVLALLLLLPAGWLAATSGFQIMEARTRDLRFRLRPDRAPDPRIVLVSIDDAALAADATPLIARADRAGEQLQRMFAGQPEALGIDLLLPVQWSHSRAFQELILQHARNLRLALLSTPQGETSGVECISPMVAGALGHDAIDRLFAFVNFEVDPDGAARWARYSYRDRSGAQRPSLAAAVTGRNQTPDEKFWLDQSIRWQDLPRISWKDLGRTDPAQFGGRLVFVGAEFAGSGDDAHAVPQRGARRSEISGLALHALMAATMLEGSPIGELGPGGTLLRRWLLLGVSLALFLCAPRMAAGAGVVAGVVLLSIAMDLFVFRFRALFFPMAVDYAMLSAGLVVAWWLRNRRPAFPTLAASRGAKRGV